jgi:hypothetical protein
VQIQQRRYLRDGCEAACDGWSIAVIDAAIQRPLSRLF